MSGKGHSPGPAIPMTILSPANTLNGPPTDHPLYPPLPHTAVEIPSREGKEEGREDGGEIHASRMRDEEEISERDSIPAAGSINVDHLDLSFEECFREHKSTRAFSRLYHLTGLIYQYIKLIFYHATVLLLGLPLVILWGIINGLMAFIHTWIYNPALKATLLWVYAIAPLVTEPLRAIFKPLIDVSARIFRQIRVSTNFSGGLGWYTHTAQM